VQATVCQYGVPRGGPLENGINSFSCLGGLLDQLDNSLRVRDVQRVILFRSPRAFDIKRSKVPFWDSDRAVSRLGLGNGLNAYCARSSQMNNMFGRSPEAIAADPENPFFFRGSMRDTLRITC
jgi:hypothetical protein